MQVEMARVGKSIANTFLQNVSKETNDNIDSIDVSSKYHCPSIFNFHTSSAKITIKINRRGG